MARRQLGNLGSGDVHKFTEVGQRLCGTLLAVRDGDFGGLADIETESGDLVTIGLSHQLQCLRTEAKVGEEIDITYLGDAKNKMGRTVKRFSVVAGTDDGAE